MEYRGRVRLFVYSVRTRRKKVRSANRPSIPNGRAGAVDKFMCDANASDPADRVIIGRTGDKSRTKARDKGGRPGLGERVAVILRRPRERLDAPARGHRSDQTARTSVQT